MAALIVESLAASFFFFSSVGLLQSFDKVWMRARDLAEEERSNPSFSGLSIVLIIESCNSVGERNTTYSSGYIYQDYKPDSGERLTFRGKIIR
jgi:hypothetical protein